MSRFIPGDYVRPINPEPGLPRGSVWVVRSVSAISTVELDAANAGPGFYPPSYVLGRAFADNNFEKVIRVCGRWQAVDKRAATFDPLALDEPRLVGVTVTGRVSVKNTQNISNADPVQAADKLVEQAAATLDAAKENARKAREEAEAAKAAKAKADKEAVARAKAEAARKALAAKLHADRCLGEATLALIAEVSRLNNGGAERPADASIAAHCDQLQPLARSYGYRIAKPSMIALVVKL